MLATLEPAPVFASYAAEIVPLYLPEGVTVHHVWLLVEIHDILEVTVKPVVPEDDVTF